MPHLENKSPTMNRREALGALGALGGLFGAAALIGCGS